jgi:BirA family biotin operon repressor/biotin-[acetyl-CoA-carboxylase] ligase
MSRDIHRYDSIDSTMHRARELAAQGCPSGTAVVAAEQTAGHGRYGRSWHSSKGDGLYVSIVLRIGIKPADLPVTTLALGLAAADAIAANTGVRCDLRWPNDVMIGDRKCAGILTELHDGVIIAGIGINVNHAGFPEDIAALATSLYLATRCRHDAEALLDALLSSIDEHLAILTSDGPHAVINAFAHASSYAHGRRVIVDAPGETIEGTTTGLTSDGFLSITDAQGRRHTIIAGGVRPAG